MGRKADISDFVKGQIYALKQEGYSQTAISYRLKISRKAVQISLRSPPVDGIPRLSKTGRKRITTRARIVSSNRSLFVVRMRLQLALHRQQMTKE